MHSSLIRRPFNYIESCVIRSMFDAWKEIPQIVERLNQLPSNEEKKRNNYQVLCGMRDMKLKHPPHEIARRNTAHANEANARSRNQQNNFAWGDMRFKKAMIAAAEAGTENVFFGVIKDRSPFAGKFMRPEPNMSIAGSSSASCADEGSRARSFAA